MSVDLQERLTVVCQRPLTLGDNTYPCAQCPACMRERKKHKQEMNAKRQAAYRKRQKELGRITRSILMTDEELFYVERVLEEMRKTGGKPAAMRDAKGRFYHFDV